MTKATELRDMSDEQLGLTLKEADRELVPAADPVADRAARRAQRAATQPAADRPDQDDSNAADDEAAAAAKHSVETDDW